MAELGPRAAEELPEVVQETPKPRDAGADSLVNELIVGLDERSRHLSGSTRIRIANIRNMSRAPSAEFEQFLDRFAELLSRSGRDLDVAFLSDAESNDAEFDLLGSAYLIVADGFDTWELFLTLTPAGEGWTIWRAPWPVRVLRQPRPRHQQIFIPQ